MKRKDKRDRNCSESKCFDGEVRPTCFFVLEEALANTGRPLMEILFLSATPGGQHPRFPFPFVDHL